MLLLKRNYFLVHKKKKYKCSIGKNGIRRYKMEGDLCTPTGVFELGPIYFRKDRIPKLNTKMKKFSIEKNMYWEDDPKKKIIINYLLIKEKCQKVYIERIIFMTLY